MCNIIVCNSGDVIDLHDVAVVKLAVPAAAADKLSDVYWLSAQSERCAGDGRRQVQAFGDLTPQLLVDDFNQSALGHHQTKQFVQVQSLLRHDRDTIHRRSYTTTITRTLTVSRAIWPQP